MATRLHSSNSVDSHRPGAPSTFALHAWARSSRKAPPLNSASTELGPHREYADGRDLWNGLTTGRLRYVDLYEAHGRRTIIVEHGSDQEFSHYRLTPVEARTARLAGQALSNKEIAATLHISESAAENHLSRALRKLCVRDRVLLATIYSWLEHAGWV